MFLATYKEYRDISPVCKNCPFQIRIWKNRALLEIIDLQFGFFVNRQNLVAGKIISAQPTARKKIKNRYPNLSVIFLNE